MLFLKTRVAAVIMILIFAIVAVPLTARLLYPLHYRPLIVEQANVHQIDPRLIAAVMRVESHFNPVSVSDKGARGLMQIMPETGYFIAEQLALSSFILEDLFDPAINIAFGVWYLHDLLNNFQGDTILALAAYNGGRGNVRNWLADQRITVGADEASLDAIPFGETRRFVRRVLSDYRVYKLLYPGLDIAFP